MDAVYFLLLIGPLVFVHELGHFLVAKAFGLRVLKFSLGFGPIMIGRQVGETFYQIAWIPLGGFVRFLGDDPRDEETMPPEELERSWPKLARWKRALVVFAGPAMSLIFPIVCYFFVGLLRDELRSPTIGQVIPGTPAERAGLEAGDVIREIDGEPIYGFIDMQRIISSQPEQDLRVKVQRGEETVELELRPALVKRVRFQILDITEELGQIGVHNVFPGPVIGVKGGGPAANAGLQNFDLITKIGDESVRRWIDTESAFRQTEPNEEVEVAYLRTQSVGWSFADINIYEPRSTTIQTSADVEMGSGTGIELASLYVSHAIKSHPGYRAGIRRGDKIVSLDGQRIEIWEQFVDRLNLAPEKSHTVTILRGSEEHTFELEPERYQKSDRYAGDREVFRAPGIGVYRVAVMDDPVPNPNRITRAAVDSVRDTLDVIKFMSIGLLRIFQGRVSLQSIGGPLMLWDLAGTAGRQGVTSFLSILALISVNLGLLNLLPVPVLDGGHLMLLGIEAIRRRPLTLKTREIINIVGLVLLLILMVFALKNDIQRYLDWEDIVQLFQ